MEETLDTPGWGCVLGIQNFNPGQNYLGQISTPHLSVALKVNENMASSIFSTLSKGEDMLKMVQILSVPIILSRMQVFTTSIHLGPKCYGFLSNKYA